ncbi:hypothetical protein AB0J86_29805 [Micromonospora sp. NPDC049559]|uniref:hypothetical protein n=1 Tax=Micromonospora sp. NPDC049559 TaxID=3155923 RepID=UPI00341A2486
MVPAIVTLNVCVAALVGATVAFAGRYRLPRPPIGTYTYGDMMIIITMVVVAPLAYLALPGPVVATVFGLVLLVAVQLGLAPLLGGRVAWLVATGLCLVTAAAWLLDRPVPVILLTDALLAVGVIAVASLWAGSGMRAGHVAFLAALLTAYDLAATTLTTVMTRFFEQVQGLPFAPLFLVSHGAEPVGIGLGDLLMLALFPLVAQRSFGRPAGLVAAVTGCAVTATVGVLFATGVLSTGVPLLTVLGPLIVGQYALWRALGRRERRNWQWQRGLPAVGAGPVGPDPALVTALGLAGPDGPPEEEWLAVHEGRIVGAGASPGLARRAAREGGCAAVPLVRRATGLDPTTPSAGTEAPGLDPTTPSAGTEAPGLDPARTDRAGAARPAARNR